jgi:PKD repeat protein
MWHVMDNQELGDDYKIIITALDTTGFSDESDTTFSIVEPYVIPDLVFTEIMYNPPESGNDSLEFLEIYNNGDDTVNMEGFTMTQGVDYTFPAITLNPSDYLLIAKDSMAMLNTFSVNAYQWTSGSLSNGGEDIELTDTMGNQVDYVDYDDHYPWDTLPDGHGPSLTLCNPDLDNSLAENWTHSVNFVAVNAAGDSIWATPGFGCQVTLMANFSSDTTTVLVGGTVQFTDETTGNPTSWSWTFEGGDPATYEGETPPPVQYNNPGHWDVSLVVSDGTNSDSITREEYIWAGVQPEITDFVADQTLVTVGASTNFTSTVTGDSLNFIWTFQGGTPDTSTDENPQNIYYLIPADSLYDVTLVVNNVFGADTLVKEDYIHTIPEGFTENGMDNIVVYPNPANDILYISNPASKELKVQIVDITGKIVVDKKSSAVKTKINTGELNKGVYFVRITDMNTKVSKTGKLIIN